MIKSFLNGSYLIPTREKGVRKMTSGIAWKIIVFLFIVVLSGFVLYLSVSTE
jgi:hypothetical protein